MQNFIILFIQDFPDVTLWDFLYAILYYMAINQKFDPTKFQVCKKDISCETCGTEMKNVWYTKRFCSSYCQAHKKKTPITK